MTEFVSPFVALHQKGQQVRQSSVMVGWESSRSSTAMARSFSSSFSITLGSAWANNLLQDTSSITAIFSIPLVMFRVGQKLFHVTAARI